MWSVPARAVCSRLTYTCTIINSQLDRCQMSSTEGIFLIQSCTHLVSRTHPDRLSDFLPPSRPNG